MNLTYLKNKISFKEGLGFQDLCETDQKSARRINAGNAGSLLKTLESAALINYALINYRANIRTPDILEAVLSAIQSYSETPDKIDTLLLNKQLPFDQNEFIRCFRMAGDCGSKAVWDKLKECYDITHPIIPIEERLIIIATSRNCADIALDILKKTSTESSVVFYRALGETANIEFLKMVLTMADRFKKNQDRLNDIFFSAVKDGCFKKAALLLEHGADPNTKEASAIYYAASDSNAEFFNLLMKQNINFEKYGESLLISLHRSSSSYAKQVIPIVQNAAEKALLKNEIINNEKTRYSLPRANILSDVLLLPSGIKLTTLFNFQSRQQIIITESKASLSTSVTGFKDLENSVIEEALKKLIAMGGTASNDWMQKAHTKKITLNKD